jgi:hypothetical protein
MRIEQEWRKNNNEGCIGTGQGSGEVKSHRSRVGGKVRKVGVGLERLNVKSGI